MRKGTIDRRDFIKTSVAGSAAAASLASGITAASAGPGETVTDSAVPMATAAVFRSDMSKCLPASALTRNFEKSRWQLLDYETEEGMRGAMASARPEENCGELTLPLNVSGMHEIYLGINYTKAAYNEFSPYGQLEVKLTGDLGFRSVAAETRTSLPNGDPKIGEGQNLYKAIQETYWKTAELTGKSLVFRQPREIYRRPELAHLANLTYVKLVPLDEEAKRRWGEMQPTDETRRGALIYCTGNFTGHTKGTYTFHPADEQWILDDFAAYVGSDIKLIIFEALRGNFAVYRTRIADVGTEDNRWQENWVDPLAVYTRLAHENGLKIMASMRMIGAQYPMNREPISWARHYWRMRQYAKRDRLGIPLTGLSIAFPEVRQYWLSLLRETLAYGIDGVVIYLNRGAPFVYYEDPVVGSFQEKHNVDPRTIPASDPRWQTHCAGFMTQFLREVRKLADEKPGREVGVTISGQIGEYDKDKSQYDPIRYGCDIKSWLRERLVNYIMPSPYVAPELLRNWRQIGGPGVHLWPDLMPRTQMPHDYARLMKKYYDAGADGYCVWDGERRQQRISEWAGVQRLGHKNLLDRIIAEGPSYHRKVYLKYLAGLSVEKSFLDG